MKADEAILQRLDASTKAPHWPVGVDGLWWHAQDIAFILCG